jgi:hypothetical protein
MLMDEKDIKKIKKEKKDKKKKSKKKKSKKDKIKTNGTVININVGKGGDKNTKGGRGGGGSGRMNKSKSIKDGKGDTTDPTSGTTDKPPIVGTGAVTTPHDTTRFQTRNLLTDGIQGDRRLDGSIESATIKQNLLIKDVTDKNNLLIKENEQIKSNLLTLSNRVNTSGETIDRIKDYATELYYNNQGNGATIEEVTDGNTPIKKEVELNEDGLPIIRTRKGEIKKKPGPKPGSKKKKAEEEAEAAKAEAEAATTAPESTEAVEKNEYDNILPPKTHKIKLTRRVIKTNNYESPNIPLVSKLTGEGMQTRFMTRNIPESVPDDERKPSGEEEDEPVEEPVDNPNVFG